MFFDIITLEQKNIHMEINYYQLNNLCFDLLKDLGLNSLGLVSMLFLFGFILSLVIMTLIEFFSDKNFKGEYKWLIRVLYLFLGLVTFFATPFLFIAMVFLACEHVVAIPLAIGLYAGVWKLKSVLSSHAVYAMTKD